MKTDKAACSGSDAPTCSALESALALVDFGPCKTANRPQDWINVAGPMCAYCEGVEDVNLAAARIIAGEYRKAQAMTWIPVAERLPENFEVVAVIGVGLGILTGSVRDGAWRIHTPLNEQDGRRIMIECCEPVTHWTPLPSLPNTLLSDP